MEETVAWVFTLTSLGVILALITLISSQSNQQGGTNKDNK